MAIQNRRGQYADFDPSKAVPGELLTVLSGDPNAKDGKAVYMTFASGDVKRMATYEDMVDNIEAATEDISQDVAEQIEANVAQIVQDAQTAAQTATTKANEASQSASSVSASAAQIATNKNDISDLKSAMDDVESSIESLEGTKADVNGFYEDMTVGTAEAVLSESFTADSVPYHFRKTPFGDRLKEKIIGGTVAWNQLADFTGTATKTFNADESKYYDQFSESLSKSITTIVGHKYFISANVNRSISGNNGITITLGQIVNSPFIAVLNGQPNGYCAGIYSCVTSITGGAIAYNNYSNKKGFSDGDTISVNDIVLTDLTQMFGSTIADYIYNLEQTTAGAGVALFRELFPKDYYEYDAGSLQSVSGLQSHDEVGFNQWDEEWESGVYSTQGVKIASDNGIRSKNFIEVIPNTEYVLTILSDVNYARINYFDENKSPIEFSQFNYTNAHRRAFIPKSNCRYIKISTLADTTPYYGGVYKNDICINLSDPEKNGQYEPYKKHSYPLDSSLTLRGVPKLVDNKIQFDGDWYESDGKVSDRFTPVRLGALDWNYHSSGNMFAENALNGMNTSSLNVLLYWNYEFVSSLMAGVASLVNDKSFAIQVIGTNVRLIVRDTSYTDASAFRTAMSNVYLLYEKATPTVTEAQPYTNPQRCVEGGTEEYVTTGIVPVGHESEYYENIATKVDGLPYDLSMIAPIENGTTASKAYSTGQYFLHNDQFCKAKTAIASGATFTLNTNYEVTTVANELYTALH